MKKYMEPDIQIVSFQTEDILLISSDLLEWDGIYAEDDGSGEGQ